MAPEGSDRSSPTTGARAGAQPRATSLDTVLDRLDGEGFTGQFQARPDATILCLTCRNEWSVAGACADEVTRLEGASDPADMVIVVPLECPVCNTRGTFVAHYGPEASPEESEVLLALERQPKEGRGASPTPGMGAPPGPAG